jgi:hypothetical protein
VAAQRDRLDSIERRLENFESEQRAANKSMIESLGRIEGRLNHPR